MEEDESLQEERRAHEGKRNNVAEKISRKKKDKKAKRM